ncbi:MAG: trypsin-like peptidase domain-containing protein [Chitinispirillales bacterium]|jgi:serine protease Do|nr:trypsin-like peptidase domain-containing protein [Chitinispirillales bacterium]
MADKTRAVIPVMLICVAAAAVGFFIGGEVIHSFYAAEFRKVADSFTNDAKKKKTTRYPASVDRITAESIMDSRENAIVRATRNVAPSVVGIVVTQIQVVRRPAADNFFDFFFAPDLRPPMYRKIENIGSGFVINEEGMILTNYHVVRNASQLFVNFQDGFRAEGRIVGVDEKSDLAVVSAAAPGGRYKPVRFGNSDDCLIGEWSIALGNPFLTFINDARPTVTVGVISALNRNFAPSKGIYYQGMIQTDAPINPGNSGGPLVNTLGEVIGINSFIFTGSGANTGSVGIGFAIPINRARRVAEELLTYGYRRQVWTGIVVRDIAMSATSALNHSGVTIVNTMQQSPGDAAGLKPGDIISKINDKTIHSSADLDGLFLDFFAGDTITMQILRDGKLSSVSLVLEIMPR